MNNKTVLTLILIAALSVSAYSQQYDSESDFRIVNENGGAVILEYLGSKKEVRVPPRIQNLPVTGIGGYAFQDCSSLTSVTIPAGVTIIGEGAFAKCASLTSVIIPAGVTIIGVNAFYQCASLTSVTIPVGVTIIGGAAFAFCSSLTSITIPDSVTIIERGAFAFCSNLTSVTIPASVTIIERGAFMGCESLTSVTFQGTIASNGFDDDVFYELGDLHAKFYASDPANGTPGTYTREIDSNTWIRM